MELNYCSPRIVTTYNQVIITEKINANSIKDEEAKGHLCNIGKIIANLHNLSIELKENWEEILMIEFKELKELAKNVMEK